MSQNQTRNIRIKSKVDFKENWENINPTLLEDEIGYEIETGKYKIGRLDQNGNEMNWNNLPYAQAGVGDTTNNNGEIFNLYENTEYTYNGINIDVDKNSASGKYTHAEGVGTKAIGDGSHAEGVLTTAYGVNSHAEGGGTNALGVSSHAEGLGLTFDCDAYKKEYINGKQYLYVKTSLDIEGVNQLSSVRKNNLVWIETNSTNHTGGYYIIQDTAEYSASDIISGIINGYKIELNKQLPSDWNVSKSSTKKVTIMMGAACAIASHVEGKSCVTVDLDANKLDTTESDKQRQHAEGSHTLASGFAAHSEGQYTIASGDRAHAEGDTTEASGLHSHAEGHKTVASAREAHAEGNGTTASGEQAHAEGLGTTASGNQAHAEGNGSKATNVAAHAEGENTEAVSKASHSEGSNTHAYNYGAHAEGRETWAKGNSSHAEGLDTVADKVASHAEGRGTIANREGQHVEGTYNVANDNFLHILGNGDSDTARSNAHTIDVNGNAWFAGMIAGKIFETKKFDNTAEFNDWLLNNIELYKNYLVYLETETHSCTYLFFYNCLNESDGTFTHTWIDTYDWTIKRRERDGNWIEIKKPPFITKTILYASNWIDNIYSSLNEQYNSSNYDLEINIDGDQCTLEQKKVFDEANMVGLSNNTIRALGTIPSIDIPIVIKISPKEV